MDEGRARLTAQRRISRHCPERGQRLAWLDNEQGPSDDYTGYRNCIDVLGNGSRLLGDDWEMIAEKLRATKGSPLLDRVMGGFGDWIVLFSMFGALFAKVEDPTNFPRK